MARLILLGQNIKKYRKAKGLKQAEVALALNCTYDFVSKVENGQRYLSLRRLFNLADILNVEVKDLMNFK